MLYIFILFFFSSVFLWLLNKANMVSSASVILNDYEKCIINTKIISLLFCFLIKKKQKGKLKKIGWNKINKYVTKLLGK